VRIVIFGAGAVGSVIGGRLFQHRERHRYDITLVARPTHCAAIRENGLTVNDPHGTDVLSVPVVERIADVRLDAGDVVVLTMKTQDTAAALDQLQSHAPADIAVVCAQNGVENERLALRCYANTYAMCVMLPAVFLEPGVVDAFGSPHNAILDIGRYPGGTDGIAGGLAEALSASGFASESVADIMSSKYAKLLMNLGNPIDALVPADDASHRLVELARAEAIACLTSAGVAWVSADDDQRRRIGVMGVRPVPGRARGGGSTWQSLQRGSSTTEVDYLNGEVVLLGRLHGVATPVNSMLCDATRWAAAHGVGPRSLTAAELLERVPGSEKIR